jgi:hypothetical protein
MRIREIKEALNQEFKQFEGQKIIVGEFHETIKDTIKKVLNKYGIKSIEYITWDVVFKNDSYKKVFDVILDTEDDKRCKWERKGKVINLYCVMSKDNECFEDLTLKEYYQKLEYKEKYEALNRIRESIAEKQKEIEELKNHEENLKKELGL